MIKIAAFALVAVAAAGVASASELRVLDPHAPSVHVQLAGKSAAEVKAQILAASKQVCDGDEACVADTVADATLQFRMLAGQAHAPQVTEAKLDVVRDGETTVRIALEQKSPAVIEAEINAAANAVCKAANEGVSADVSACVTRAVDDAHRQLKTMVVASN